MCKQRSTILLVLMAFFFLNLDISDAVESCGKNLSLELHSKEVLLSYNFVAFAILQGVILLWWHFLVQW